jgi:iron complex transport system substrate-binding protein
MVKRSFTTLLLLLVLFGYASASPQMETAKGSAKSETVTITDSLGREVEVPYKPQRIVVTYGPPAEIIAALGCTDQIVGVTTWCRFPPALKDKPQLGAAHTPGVEQIVGLRPDAVFAFRGGYGGDLKPEIERQLLDAGIPVIFVNCLELDHLFSDIEKMGKILGKEEQAKAYIEVIKEPLDIVARRLEGLTERDKPSVYVAAASNDITTFSRGQDGHAVIELAGGKNIAADLEPLKMPRISVEWLTEQDPDIIVKFAKKTGYDTKTTDSIRATKRELEQKPGFRDLAAVKNGRVYALSVSQLMSPRSTVQVAYLAKWFFPDRFKDVSPEELHRAIVENYYDVEFMGAWAYPKPE